MGAVLQIAWIVAWHQVGQSENLDVSAIYVMIRIRKREPSVSFWLVIYELYTLVA